VGKYNFDRKSDRNLIAYNTCASFFRSSSSFPRAVFKRLITTFYMLGRMCEYPRYLLDQSHGLYGDLWFGRSRSGLVFPKELEALTMPTEERFWLNDEKRLLPDPHHPGQQHQEHPVRSGACWSFHVSAKDDELLA
jgi:hypothetical protein